MVVQVETKRLTKNLTEGAISAKILSLQNQLFVSLLGRDVVNWSGVRRQAVSSLKHERPWAFMLFLTVLE